MEIDSHKTSDFRLAAVSKALDVVLASNGPADVCKQIVHAGFADGRTRGCALFFLDSKSQLKSIASYGQIMEIPSELSAWDETSLSAAIRTKTVTSGVANVGGVDMLVLAVPFVSNGTPSGLAAVFIDQAHEQINVPEDLGKLISKLGAFYLDTLDFGTVANGKGSLPANPDDLTSRQLMILTHIQSGLVNLEIAKLLMLSKSTIRQETVRIYKSLGVGNRQEAVKKARALGLLSKVTPPPALVDA